jgi:hypothetical protein
MVIPMVFGEVEVLVQAAPATTAGSEDVSVGDRLRAAYANVEPAVVAVASSISNTVGQLAGQPHRPRQVEVNFGVGVSIGGDVVLIKSEATLAISLTYELP